MKIESESCPAATLDLLAGGDNLIINAYCSITTGGGCWLIRILAGSIVATPRIVANQSFPSLLLQADGSPPPLHSRVIIPSAVP